MTSVAGIECTSRVGAKQRRTKSALLLSNILVSYGPIGEWGDADCVADAVDERMIKPESNRRPPRGGPEYDLMLAVLDGAIADLFDKIPSRRADAEAWIAGCRAPIRFETACDMLGLDVRAVSSRLLAIVRQHGSRAHPKKKRPIRRTRTHGTRYGT